MIHIVTDSFQIKTHGNDHIIDITPTLRQLLRTHKLQQGNATVFISGSTAGVTTVEHEPGLVKDLPEAFERIAPKHHRYHHDDTWQDGNGHAHVRASLLGPSLTIPFTSQEFLLGTWQQVIVIDFDNRSRVREIVVQFIGE